MVMKLGFRKTQVRQPPAARSATDEELLCRYRRGGEPLYFAELVRRYETELYTYLHRYLGDGALAEDAFQATFLQVHLKCHQYDETRKVRPWLFAIATNQAIDAQRRNKRHRLVSLDQRNRHAGADAGTLGELSPSLQPGPDEQLELGESRQQARDAVAALPESLRTAVHLIYYQGLKYREAAEVLKIPVGTVKSRLHTAVRKLGELLGGGSSNGDPLEPPDGSLRNVDRDIEDGREDGHVQA
jgi:RNA polymerase sigma-70 factor (ECF subfamily)